MLHKNVQMVDIDVDHWRNLQQLFLESSKEKRRIILIHEGGRLLKFVHSDRIPIVRSIDRIADPHVAAQTVYGDNRELTDFVLVLDRQAVERYMTEVQNAWSPEADIDEYVHHMYEKLGEYGDGIVTYPGRPETNLGIQWRIGTDYDGFRKLVQDHVAPESTAVLALVDDGALWASLVLGFDRDRRIDLVTSLRIPTGTRVGGPKELADRIARTADEPGRPRSIGLFAELQPFADWIEGEAQAAALPGLLAKGKFILDPNPL